MELGGHIIWEWPNKSNRAWDLPCMVKFLKCFQTLLHISYLDGCCVGLRSVDGLQLLLKPWRIISSCENVAKVLERRCQGNHTRKNIEGIETPHSAYYPKPMCKLVARVISRSPTWHEVTMHFLHSNTSIH